LELDSVTLRLHLPVAAGSVALVTIVLMIQKRVSRRLGAMLALGYLVYVAVAVGLALR
jgi:hypothetical protein